MRSIPGLRFWPTSALVVSVLVGLCAQGAPARSVLAASPQSSVARIAQTLSVKSSAHMTLVGGSGNTLIEEGHSHGSLSGRIRASLVLNGTSVECVFTVYLHSGSVTGRGTGKLNVGHGTYASFAGTLQISRGTGRYRHAKGSGSIYGTLNRNDDNAIVQAAGTMRY